MATALDHATAGRMLVGIGAGWHEPEIEAFGYEQLGLGDRIGRLGEAASRPRVAGRRVGDLRRPLDRAAGMRNDPPPVQARMPLLVAGSGEKRTSRIVALDADIWNGEGSPELYAHKNAVLDRWCAEVGRDPGDPADRRRPAGADPGDPVPRPSTALAATSAGSAAPAQARWLGRELAARRHRRGRRPASSARLDAAGAEEAIIDQPAPLDDETLERLAASCGRVRMTDPPRPRLAAPSPTRQCGPAGREGGRRCALPSSRVRAGSSSSDVPDPVPGPDEVLIEVEACGVCGSDVQIINVPPGHPSTPPVIIGHEFVGRIRAVGSAVARRRRSAAGVVRRPRPEVRARATRAAPGDPANCTNIVALGVHRDGALAALRHRPGQQRLPDLPTTSRPSWPRSSSRWPASSTARTGRRSGRASRRSSSGPARSAACSSPSSGRPARRRSWPSSRARQRAPVARAVGADVVLTPDEWAARRGRAPAGAAPTSSSTRSAASCPRRSRRRRWAPGSSSSG